MAFAALLSITLVPALAVSFLKGRITPEAKNPINRFASPPTALILRRVCASDYAIVALALLATGLTVIPLLRLGSEFMPPLYEGDLLYMPISVPASRFRRQSGF
jgi:Cu(I)/Ag(I) efflux system membrane protein CusA/SilA